MLKGEQKLLVCAILWYRQAVLERNNEYKKNRKLTADTQIIPLAIEINYGLLDFTTRFKTSLCPVEIKWILSPRPLFLC